VVQPGVEFGDDHVTYYQREKAKVLSNKILEYENLVFEVHSTDYQTESGLKSLVEDHFCILKVGPWLTYAFREALFALEAMESELFGKKNVELSRLTYTLDKAMLSFPDHWKDWYTGDENEKSFKRRYSFSDRARYYWHLPELEKAKSKLFNNLSDIKIPLTLLSQFMPTQFYLADIMKNPGPKDLLYCHIRTVASIYSRACGLS